MKKLGLVLFAQLFAPVYAHSGHGVEYSLLYVFVFVAVMMLVAKFFNRP